VRRAREKEMRAREKEMREGDGVPAIHVSCVDALGIHGDQ
jgi:hypothetical protein